MAPEYHLEIQRLLKLGGDHLIVHGVPEGLPVAEEKIVNDPLVESIDLLSETTKKSAKSFFIYPIIFISAFVFFYVVLNFSSVWAQVKGFFIKPQTQNQQILGDQLAPYYQWINGYFYAVNDPTLLDPNNDIDKDGLSNMDEFIMRTNPTVADSDGDGFSDGIEVINGDNPWGSGRFTSEQKQLAEKLNAILINNRISYNISQNKDDGKVSGATTNKFDLNQPGRLSIPKLNLQVALVWSKDPADFEKDLSTGVIHYPGTALPGEVGTIYVSGHSSDYIWKKDPFHDVFARLNYLAPGDDIFIDVYGVDGKVYNYRYQVVSQATYKPDDQTQFIDNSTKKLNLSTCWPIGTQKDRLVVSAVEVGL